MKAWKIDGNWLHKKSGKTHNLQFVVVCEDNDDPVGVLNARYDMKGMTQLNGKVERQYPPFAIPINTP